MAQSNNPFFILLTGLSASGKTTISNELKKMFEDYGFRKYHHLDGDQVRSWLTSDLGFSREDRFENIARVTKLGKTINDLGISVIASFICPYTQMRNHIDNSISNYIEVYISTPLEICEQRDPRGLYQKARSGEIKTFTGVSDIYETPSNPHLNIDTSNQTPSQSAQKIFDYLIDKSLI